MKKTGINKRPPKNKSTKTTESKYLKVPSTESNKKFKEIGEMVDRKELKWSHFVVENSVGMHIYLKLKK
jgi:hypothetical protein